MYLIGKMTYMVEITYVADWKNLCIWLKELNCLIGRARVSD